MVISFCLVVLISAGNVALANFESFKPDPFIKLIQVHREQGRVPMAVNNKIYIVDLMHQQDAYYNYQNLEFLFLLAI